MNLQTITTCPRIAILICCLLLIAGLTYSPHVLATHAATVNGEIEDRPSPVFRRICQGGTNAGDYCKGNAECPGSTCADRNVFNITVAIAYDAPEADLTTVQTLIAAMSTELFDATDGQAEIGTVTIHNNAISTNQADFVVFPSTNDTWWQANSGHYRTGGFMMVSINYITDPANQGNILAHEFSHLVFDVRDEYESRAANCGAVVGGASCPVAAANDGTCLMDSNGSEYCWGQGDTADLTDLTGGNHDPSNVTEQSSCRNDRSCWDQLSWSWPKTIAKPADAPDPAANGAVVNPPNFILTDDNVRVVLVLDESGSMGKESPTRLQRLQVAANDFITTAENGTELGLVSYSTDAGAGHANVAIAALGADRTAWSNATAGLNPDGMTNIGDGLQKAKDMIVAAGGVTANTYILLMTDGLNNRPGTEATAATDLQEKIDDLLASGIPVYVTCTGGDTGLQSQCSEIASGTNGFGSDSADAARLPEKFIDFHERMTGFQSIDSVYGNFSNAEDLTAKTIFVDEGSEAVSFVLLWEHEKARSSLTLKDPDGKSYRARNIPQGMYARIEAPKPGNWQMVFDPSGGTNSNFVARAYTHNRINSFVGSVRRANHRLGEEIYIYASARSLGGAITRKDKSIQAQVTLPDGSQEIVELFDQGRDADGHGDDLAGDGMYTGVFKNTSQAGAYNFHFKVDIEKWGQGEESHRRDAEYRSPRFLREVSVSTAVFDPNAPEKIVEDRPESQSATPCDPDDCEIKRIRYLIWILLLVSLLTLFMVWRCCRSHATHKTG